MPQRPLPVIDLAASWRNDAQALRETAGAIDAACRARGFFYVVGHGVPLALTSHLLMLSRRLFQLPEAVKREWHIDRSGIQRGFDPIGWQALAPGQPPDLKESFYLGVERGPDDPLVRAAVPQQGPNQWPAEGLLPGFRLTSEAYARAMQRLARHLMGLIALGLGLPRTYFDASMRDPMPVLRLLHYPPQPLMEEDAAASGPIGCGAHTDWGALTLLAQDSAGGLQVQDVAGGWLTAPPLDGSFVVNLGDLMQRWTNDRYHSTLHRVVNTVSGRDRHAMAYFHDIDYHAQVQALPGCSDAANPPRYAPITAGAHITEMYRRTTTGQAGIPRAA